MSLLRGEAIKLFTTRTTWAMLGIGLLAEALFVGLYVGLSSLGEIGEFEEVTAGVGLLLLLILVLGVLVITTEFRHGTASSTFLVSPRRWPVLVAKLAAALLVGLLAGLAFVIVNAGLGLPLYEGKGGQPPGTDDLVSLYAGVVVSFGLICAFGFGIGAIVRAQVGAIITAIAVIVVLSPLPLLLPGSVGDYFPSQAIGSLHGTEEGEGSLNQVGGGLVLGAWTAALAALGTLLVTRRDVAE